MKNFLYGLLMGIGFYRRTMRLRAALTVLRGRPLVYRVNLEAGPGIINFAPGSQHIHMVESRLSGHGDPSASGTHLYG